MSNHRKDLRDAVRAALAADARIGAVPYVRAWVRPKGKAELPAYTVFIPRDPSAKSDRGGIEQRTQIHVIFKRGASETIEDELDEDVAAIEAAVLPALLEVPDLTHADTDGPEFSMSGEGNSTVAEAIVRFSVQIFKPIPTSG